MRVTIKIVVIDIYYYICIRGLHKNPIIMRDRFIIICFVFSFCSSTYSQNISTDTISIEAYAGFYKKFCSDRSGKLHYIVGANDTLQLNMVSNKQVNNKNLHSSLVYLHYGEALFTFNFYEEKDFLVIVLDTDYINFSLKQFVSYFVLEEH